MEALSQGPVDYPEDDGKRLAENTAQLDWIVLLKGNLELAVADFVAADLLWYPIEGDNQTRAAPDAMVALGRPKGGRSSYKQWEEGGVAPQVVFEVLSPSNTVEEMADKLAFYERFGVREYYVIDPDLLQPENAILEVFLRKKGQLRLASFQGTHKSPLLGISFQRTDGRLTVYLPDGSPFRTLAQLAAQRDELAAQRDAVSAENARLRERLRAAGIDPDAL